MIIQGMIKGFIVLIVFLSGCTPDKTRKQAIVDSFSTTALIKSTHKPPAGRQESSFAEDTIVRSGLFLEGDFNGDNSTDRLTEYFISSITGKEIEHFNESPCEMEEEDTIMLTAVYKPYIRLASGTSKVPDFLIGKGQPILGFHWLHNEGDLDGDGGDEFSYVPQWADCSNVNDCILMSWKKGRWRELYRFGVWEWQLMTDEGQPPFKGFITKVKPGVIKVVCRNEEAEEETRTVRLK